VLVAPLALVSGCAIAMATPGGGAPTEMFTEEADVPKGITMMVMLAVSVVCMLSAALES
jgi:hypothetical protein